MRCLNPKKNGLDIWDNGHSNVFSIERAVNRREKAEKISRKQKILGKGRNLKEGEGPRCTNVAAVGSGYFITNFHRGS